MSRYDGLIIPRSYSEYINKTDAATLSQALQLSGVMDNAPTAQSTKPAKSGGIFASNAVIMASNKTLSGVAISAGSVVRVMFTAALTGSDATTGLTLTYNGNTYAVKVGKDGALVALTAHLIEESYIYLQAYTTLELAFDGSQFVVMGNPVVISNADFSIMADGSITYTKTKTDNTFTKYNNLGYEDAEGRGFINFNLSNFIDVSVEDVYHFKVFCISDMWTSALAEGIISIYQGNINVKLDWKNDLINTISVSNNQLNVVGNSNFYGCYCTIGSIYAWTQTP